ncbi:MAG: DUF6159 family protein [Bryobacteraceae bacterium]|jgi:hypothetical protein
MGALERTWRLYMESFAVLSEDGELLLFPALSGVCAIALAAGFFVPLYRDGTLAALTHGNGSWADYVTIFAWYFLNHFLIVFFNSALIGCAGIRLSGGVPKVVDGLRIAWSRVGRIAVWAVAVATVGLFLNALNGRRNRLPWVFGAALSVGWTLVTYLMAPVLIMENRGVYDSIHRSSELFRKQWGEELIGSFGFGLLNALLLAPGFLLGLLVWHWDRGGAVIVGVVYALFLAVVSSAVAGVFKAALYRYAASGTVPPGFTAEALNPSRGIYRPVG